MTEEVIKVSWESRLAAIETNHLQLQKDVSALASDVSALTQAVKSIGEAVKRIADNQTAGMRTNWGAVWAGLGTIAVVAALMVIEPLYSVETRLEHHVEDGHPHAVRREVGRVEEIVAANYKAHERRLDRKQDSILRHEEVLVKLQNAIAGIVERTLDLEREVYTDACYRAGRPSKSGGGAAQ